MDEQVTAIRQSKKPRRLRRLALALGGVLVAVFVVLEGAALALPRNNPPVVAEPPWDSPQTRELFMRTCGDCHSNQTHWRWYTDVAPIAFLAYRDVTEGRQKCNVSEWGVGGERECDDSAEAMQKGTMPPWFYRPLHPEAQLSPQEKQRLIQGLLATFGEGTGPEQEGLPGDENGEQEGEGRTTPRPIAFRLT
ncbi:MAG: heme-binding domain-containing protein [Thermomicrobium sp.]|nr:heme-binding domain-containing protein [Thermomicrobium sp.]